CAMTRDLGGFRRLSLIAWWRGRVDSLTHNSTTSKQYVAMDQGVAKKPKKSSWRWATLDFGTTTEFGEIERDKAPIDRGGSGACC
ncbi:MAG TPA: hypothetical protein VFF52_23955, partial [Isosphaeraceae bacterium]|nr:hypothetical protein [Isosphaeraceae bacterium]